MTATSSAFQQLSGHGELYISGEPSIGVLYYILFLTPVAPPSGSMAYAAMNGMATGHMTPLQELAIPLDLTAQYTLALSDGRQIGVNLVSSSMEQFGLYTFECAVRSLL